MLSTPYSLLHQPTASPLLQLSDLPKIQNITTTYLLLLTPVTLTCAKSHQSHLPAGYKGLRYNHRERHFQTQTSRLLIKNVKGTLTYLGEKEKSFVISSSQRGSGIRSHRNIFFGEGAGSLKARPSLDPLSLHPIRERARPSLKKYPRGIV